VCGKLRTVSVLDQEFKASHIFQISQISIKSVKSLKSQISQISQTSQISQICKISQISNLSNLSNLKSLNIFKNRKIIRILKILKIMLIFKFCNIPGNLAGYLTPQVLHPRSGLSGFQMLHRTRVVTRTKKNQKIRWTKFRLT